MIFAILLFCFTLNIINHGNILVGILNSLLLLFSIFFYLEFSHQKLSSFKSSFPVPPLIFIAAIPLFTQNHDVFVILLATGTSLLFLYYFTSKFKKIVFLIIILYLLLSSFYASGVIKLPFLFQSNRFILSDDWTNLYISRMQVEALYMPYKLRLIIFNSSVYFYVLLSKVAGLFTFKNYYDVLLVANLYPLAKGLILDLKNWNRSKTLIILSIVLVSFVTVSSRSVDILKTFTLLSPFLLYFILRGFNSINKMLYFVLFIFSIFIASSPYK